MKNNENEEPPQKVFLIGCGPGDIKHLTLEAYEIIPKLDAALVDGLVGDEIKALLSDSCEVIDVTKKKGRHSASQDEINELLYRCSKTNKLVGRLKGGDTSVFARTAEEADYLIERGVDVQIVGGISSSLAACNSSGIFPTIRGVSSSFSVASAHVKGSVFNEDWIGMLKIPNHTTVVLMGHSFAKEIQKAAKKIGVDANLPAAYVSNIDSPKQKTIIGTLKNLDDLSNACEKPAVLIIGNVVGACENTPFTGERVFL